MERRNILITFILLGFLCYFNEIHAQYEPNETLDKFKELSDFENWRGKSGPIRDGLNLSNSVIQGLADAVEVKQKMPFFLWEIEEGELMIKHRSRWEVKNGNLVEITLTFAENCEDAHEFLIKRYFDSQKPFEARIPKTDQPIVAGDISFSDGRKFVRNNIVVEIYAEGEMITKLSSIAKDVDNLLLAKATSISANQFKPLIRQFDIEHNYVLYRSSTKLIIDAYDPKGGDLYYFWKITGGGIEEDEHRNYFYYADAQEGSTQIVTLIVVNDRGYYSSADIEIKIE